ncbi:hypothetical protein GCM10022402_38020 [Salinactinospora qingdaonensis]|uniref:Malonyl-CoA:ACP transacylase (MAT) domain-containing protein n=2 Tax=Salinactinospora qingdaonensis TaxID=702744 RepID=A0ABP7G5S2_9ACTN
MATDLYAHDSSFAATVDTVLDLFDDAELRADWLSERPRVPIGDVTRAQPLLFTMDYALARLVLDRGVRPAALLGHSVGELVAAVLAEVFSLQDAVAIMRDRVRRLADGPRGGTLTVAAGVQEIRPILGKHPEVAIAAVNAPRQTAIAGLDTPLRAAEAELRAAGFTVLPVAARTAFHSPALAPLLEGLSPYESCARGDPRIPLWSSATTHPLDAAAVRDDAMWARQPMAPVLFWAALDRLVTTNGPVHLVDVGPGQGLATVARRHPDVQRGHSTVTALLPARRGVRVRRLTR